MMPRQVALGIDGIVRQMVAGARNTGLTSGVVGADK
jgi:hypothetical protein